MFTHDRCAPLLTSGHQGPPESLALKPETTKPSASANTLSISWTRACAFHSTLVQLRCWMLITSCPTRAGPVRTGPNHRRGPLPGKKHNSTYDEKMFMKTDVHGYVRHTIRWWMFKIQTTPSTVPSYPPNTIRWDCHFIWPTCSSHESIHCHIAG